MYVFWNFRKINKNYEGESYKDNHVLCSRDFYHRLYIKMDDMTVPQKWSQIVSIATWL